MGSETSLHYQARQENSWGTGNIIANCRALVFKLTQLGNTLVNFADMQDFGGLPQPPGKFLELDSLRIQQYASQYEIATSIHISSRCAYMCDLISKNTSPVKMALCNSVCGRMYRSANSNMQSLCQSFKVKMDPEYVDQLSLQCFFRQLVLSLRMAMQFISQLSD